MEANNTANLGSINMSVWLEVGQVSEAQWNIKSRKGLAMEDCMPAKEFYLKSVGN